MVTYDNGEEEDEDDLDSEEERGAEMAVDDDTPWVEPPLVGSDGDPFSAGAPVTSTRGAEIDRWTPVLCPFLKAKRHRVGQLRITGTTESSTSL